MKRRSLFFLIMMLLFASMTVSVCSAMRPAVVSAATKWTDGVDKSIYDNPDKKEKNVDIGNADDKKLGEKSSKGLGGLIAGLLNDISDWLDVFFKTTGMTLKNIIYGRVGGGGVLLHLNGKSYRTSLFTFETVSGNPYGIVAFAIYGVLRVLSFIMATIFVGGRFVSAMWSTNTEAAKKAGMEALKNALLFFILLMGMPMMMDLCFYLRDVFLYVVNYQGTQLLGLSSGADIGSAFDILAEDTPKSLMLAVVRLASKFMTLYFAFTYIGVVMGFIVVVITFPLIGISMLVNPRILEHWIKSFISFLLVPVVDCVLFLVVLVMSAFGANTTISILQLILLYMLVPARAEARSLLGISSGFRMEMAGLAGYATALGLAGAAVQGIGSVMRGGKNAWDMNRRGDMYDDIAEAKKQQQKNNGDDENGHSGDGRIGDVVNDPEGPSDGGGGGGVVNDYGSASTSAANETLSGAAEGAATYNSDNDNETMETVDVDTEESGNAATRESTIRTMGGNYIPNSILRKYANTGNFQDGMFNMLTEEQKAALCHKKAEQMAVGTVLSAMGGVTGAGIGLAATVSSGGGFGGFGPGTAIRTGKIGAAMTSDIINSANIGLRGEERMQQGQQEMINPLMGQQMLLEQTSATFGEEELAAANAFREANPVFDAELAGMESYSDIEGFDDMFDQCTADYAAAIGTPKPSALQMNGNEVWQDTPDDRYQYFRTQKAPEFLTKAFNQRVDTMTPLADSRKNEMARDLIGDAFRRTVSNNNYGGLSQDMLALQGYSFQNGFNRVSPDSEVVRAMARERFMSQNPGITSVINNLSDVESNVNFQNAFDSCAGEWAGVLNTAKPEYLQNGLDSVWQDTPDDRYQYFRTQKAEPILKNSFGSALDTMAPLSNAKSNEIAKKAVLDEYAKSISNDNYAALKKDNLELFGFNFENGFERLGHSGDFKENDSSVIV